MRYRIEYADGRCCNFANSRKDLLDWLKLLKDEQIVDIRKIYGLWSSGTCTEYSKVECIHKRRCIASRIFACCP